MFSFQTPYAYAANNPISFIDFMGMSPIDPDPTYTAKGAEATITAPRFDRQYKVTDSSGEDQVYRGQGAAAPYIYDFAGAGRISGDSKTLGNQVTEGFLRNETNIPSRFMNHWKLGNGAPYNLTDYEFNNLGISSYGVGYGQVASHLYSLDINESKQIEFGVLIRANQSATLGNATIMHTGILTRTGNTSFSFNGTAHVYDIYDFNLSGRIGGDYAATLAGKFANNAGKTFEIFGPTFNVNFNQNGAKISFRPMKSSLIRRL